MTLRILGIVFLLCSVLMPARALAVEGNDDINLSNDSATDAEPSIGTNPADANKMVVASVGASLNKVLRTWYTTNGGVSWSSVSIGSEIDGIQPGDLCVDRADPSVAIADDVYGTVYVGYVAAVPSCSKPYTVPWQIWCAKSTNGGSSYTGMQVGSGLGADKPYLTVGPKPGGSPGYNVYVTYNVDGGTVYLGKSEDGNGFAAPVATSMSGSFTVPAVDRLGNLYVVWLQSYATANPTVAVGRSTNGGSSFTTTVLGSTNVGNTDPTMAGRLLIPAAPTHGVPADPSIAIDRRDSGIGHGRIYVTYVTRTSTVAGDYDLDVVLQYSDNGLVWSDPVVIHKTDANSQFHPWVSVDQSSGKVAVLYLDARNDITSPANGAVETWVSVSNDGGDTWYEKKISDHTTDQSCTSGQSRNYLEYLGASFANGTIRGVWPGNPTGVACGDPNGQVLDIVFDTMPAADVTTYQVLSVPSAYSTVSAAMQVAKAGDRIEVTGTAAGAFTMASNVPVVSIGGTAVLDANGASTLVTFPIRYHGTGLTSFRLEDFTGTAIAALLPATQAPAKIPLTSLVITNPRGQAQKAIDLTNVDSTWVSNCSISGGMLTGIAAAGGTGIITATTIDGGEKGVFVTGNGTVKILSSTLLNQSAQCVDVSGAIADVELGSLQGSGSSTLLRVTNSKFLTGGEPTNRLFGATLQNGSVGVDATNSYLKVESCTLTNQTAKGISITFPDSDYLVHTRIISNLITSTSQTAEGVYLGGFGAQGFPNPRAEVRQNTIDGYGTGVHAEMIVQQGSGKFNVALTRNLITEYWIRGIDITAGTGHFQGTFTHSLNDAYSTHSSINGTSGDDVNLPPLYCDNHDPAVQRYTLRMDSPGGPGNIATEGIGAKPVECAWGTLQRNTVVPASASIRVLEDVTVPSTMSLMVNHGAVLAFDDLDDSHSGSDIQKNELTVNGTVTVVGTAGDLARFESATTQSGEGKWYGIRTNSASTVSIDFASIKNAIYGVVHTSNVTSHVRDSAFSLNQNADMVIGSGGPDVCPVTVERNSITIGGSDGIALMSEVDQTNITNNILTGDGTTISGIKTSFFSSDEVPTLKENTISGVSLGAGILNGSGCDASIIKNTISSVNYGVKVTDGGPAIGVFTETYSISQCGFGIVAQGSTAMPKARYNRIVQYDKGMQAELGANPDFGISGTDQGNNSITSGNPGSVCINNQNSGGIPQCRAQGNYFGGSGPGCPAPICTSGNVDLANWLCSDPTGPSAAPSEIGPLMAARGLVIRGSQREASGEGAVILFRLEEGSANVGADVFNVAGRRVSRLQGDHFGAGEHSLRWDGRDNWGARVPSGIYFVQISANENLRGTARVLIVR